MDAIALPITGIVSDPKIRSGRPIIEGTTLRVMDVAALYKYQARTPEQIAEDYRLSMPQVYAALAYYFANQVEIDTDFERESRLILEARDKSVGRSDSSLS